MRDRDTAPRAERPLTGGCHCGNLEFLLETPTRADELPLRACACTFCVKHGARATSDPQGRVTITIHDPGRVVHYRFGLRTADFLICGQCGIYVAAVMSEGSSAWATVNANTFDAVEDFARAATPFSYEGETAGERGARRRARWTPAVVAEARR